MSYLVWVVLVWHVLAVQSATTWHDPSPHEVRFVTVDSSVRLEVLDWGGSGRQFLFVGCYLTAHVYDDISLKLTDQFRVSWQADLRTGVPPARIVELPGANLYMFLTNEADVIREVRAFAASLDR